VFLHGLAGDRTHFTDLIGHLGRNYRSLNIDLPGHGGSSAAPAISVVGLARSTGPLVARTFEGPVTLVGHSMGASVCLEIAVHFPEKVRHVIALDALHQAVLYPRRGRLPAFLMGAALACVYRPGMRKLLSELFVAETPDVVRRRVIDTALATPSAVSARLLASLARWDRDCALATTDVPVTILVAGSLAKPNEVATLSPRCRVVGFPLGGHFFPTEFPVESAHAIAEAVRQLATD
jgi:pimeloyl-ACP methyl ester carboxylesterase